MEWRYLDEESCPRCGDDILCQTPKHYADGEFMDGSKVKCVDCNYKSAVTVDEDGCLLQGD